MGRHRKKHEGMLPVRLRAWLRRTASDSGFTLLELMIVLALLGVMLAVAFPDLFSYRQRVLLVSTAAELESAILLARQLSADECREYVVELTASRFSVRENVLGSKRVVSTDYPPGIKRAAASRERLVVNRNGLTGYGKFILKNSRNQHIDIEIHIGTGRVNISSIY